MVVEDEKKGSGATLLLQSRSSNT